MIVARPLAPVLAVLALAACDLATATPKEAAFASAPATASAPASSSASASAHQGGETPPVAKAAEGVAPATETPVVVAMPSASDVQAASALRCAKQKSGYGCKDARGNDVIPFSYDDPVVFKKSGLARVFHQEKGFFFINARNERVLDVFLFDNGPDPFASGLARVTWGGKVGFVDSEWRPVIPLRFDAAFGFEGESAKVCTGCDPDVWSKDAPPDAARKVGRVFFVDTTGNEVQR